MPAKGPSVYSDSYQAENPPVENRGPSWTRIVLEKARCLPGDINA